MPHKLKIAMFLIKEFDSVDFNFGIVEREDKLQAEYEKMEHDEIEKSAKDAGILAVKKLKKQ